METKPAWMMVRKSLIVSLALVVLTAAFGCTPSATTGDRYDSNGAPAAATGGEGASLAPAGNSTSPGEQITNAERASSTPAQNLPGQTPAPTAGALPIQPENVVNPVPTSGVCQSPENWMDMPVIPEYVSEQAVLIYQTGLAAGNRPNAFSVIGDCQNVPAVFFGVFENPKEYTLGEENASLQPAIDYFAGSFGREGLARVGGLNAAAVLSPFRADPDQCEADESPLRCELRANRPSIVIISLEEWWSKSPVDIYEGYLRKILDEVIASGAVPVLVTKADNLEGNNAINQTIVKLACEYQVPLWNYWAAVQPLPAHGLWKDGFHLTVGLNNFGDPLAMRNARPVRNLTGLQALDRVWRGVNHLEMVGP